MLTPSEAANNLFQAIKDVSESLGDDWIKDTFPALVTGWRPADYLYRPNDELVARLENYQDWCNGHTDENAGQLMEEIALLAFRSLRGFNSVKSYQSYAAQLDLVITGSDIDWRALMEYLHLNWQRRIIVIEAKNLENRVDDKQFARLCGILEHMFSDTAALGVFFSRYGASGFPNSDERSNRARVLRDAQATQVIFHARTNKFVIVLDHEDILQLSKPGALPKILEAKIRNVEEWTGLPSDSVDSEFCVVDLPSHLRRYMTS